METGTARETLVDWAYEVTLQLQAEGITDRQRDITIPDVLGAFLPTIGVETNHILGYTNCRDAVRYNTRMANPMSSWYDSPDWLGTVAHELVHYEAQNEGVCGSAPSDILEASANIGMLEVLAAMSDRSPGNPYAFRSFVYEWAGMTLGATMAIAARDNRMDEYEALRSRVRPGLRSKMGSQKSALEYAGHEQDRLEILVKYELMPVEILMKAHLTNHDRVEGLAYNAVTVDQTAGAYVYPPQPRVISIADWDRTVSNLVPLAREFAKG